MRLIRHLHERNTFDVKGFKIDLKYVFKINLSYIRFQKKKDILGNYYYVISLSMVDDIGKYFSTRFIQFIVIRYTFCCYL